MTVKRVNTGQRVGFAISTSDPDIMLVKTTSGIEECLTSELTFFSGYMASYELPEKTVKKIFNLV